MAKPKNQAFLNSKFLIGKFLKTPKREDYPREIVLAKKLLSQYSDTRFWNFVNLSFRLNSLAWFMTEDGIKFINQQMLLFSYVPPQEQEKYEISDVKFGENKVIEKKPKTLMDILS